MNYTILAKEIEKILNSKVFDYKTYYEKVYITKAIPVDCILDISEEISLLVHKHKKELFELN